MIVLTKQQYRDILNHSMEGLPNEACGLLGGVIENGIKRVEKVYLLANTDQSPEHFSMDPKEQFSAIKNMRANGWSLLGNFHSHPNTPSRPSLEDIRLAFDPEASYFILSLMQQDKPVLKSFQIVNHEATQEELSVEGE